MRYSRVVREREAAETVAVQCGTQPDKECKPADSRSFLTKGYERTMK
jgi:hypothetical protein